MRNQFPMHNRCTCWRHEMHKVAGIGLPLSLYFRATGDVVSGLRSSRNVSGSRPSSCSSRATFLRHFLSWL
jgi:hypothetical protein